MSLITDISRLLGRDDDTFLRLHEDLLTSLLVMAWMVEARDPCIFSTEALSGHGEFRFDHFRAKYRKNDHRRFRGNHQR
ncbi:MAG: hypothetical protein CVU17_06880 [Betaproteobacteria bacterium HGW-Betaproteobacteria-11]|nr:MAG: hypothetical protein CVU17_06880 [Betaproteobacteria bacterium HGW-Betaproteobacteria-11]